MAKYAISGRLSGAQFLDREVSGTLEGDSDRFTGVISIRGKALDARFSELDDGVVRMVCTVSPSFRGNTQSVLIVDSERLRSGYSGSYRGALHLVPNGTECVFDNAQRIKDGGIGSRVLANTYGFRLEVKG